MTLTDLAAVAVIATVIAGILLVGAWIIVARAKLIGVARLDQVVAWGAWVLVAFSILSTLTKLSGRHPLERWGMSAVALVVAILSAWMALSA